MFKYPIELTNLDNGDVMIRFPDIPEAITCGENKDIALVWAQDVLHVALADYMANHRDIPEPSEPGPDQITVSPSPMVNVKLVLYKEMINKGITRMQLARLLHCNVRQVRRILDLEHQSTLNQLIDAAEVLGFNLDLDLKKKDQSNPAGINQGSGLS